LLALLSSSVLAFFPPLAASLVQDAFVNHHVDAVNHHVNAVNHHVNA
jgi:hypothetical protein